MQKSRRLSSGIAVLAGLFLLTYAPLDALADSDSPGDGGGSASCSKFKKGSKEWKKCMGQHFQDREDAYALGYWLAKTGEFQEALDVLRRSSGESDPRVLTMIGYATRHLGRIEEAIGYYDRALALNPNMTNTRQYLGEAFLQKREPGHAREQLAEIKQRCGDSCADYISLASAIDAFEKGELKG